MSSPSALMVQGTTSDAGKSTLVAGLARVFYRKGWSIAPFKPQNMALNSAVTVDGGEIGRAQALQAQAAGVPPHSDFNPVLLKPSSDTGAQVLIHGKVVSHLSAQDFHAYKPTAMQAVMASWERLSRDYECILVEGAGSPAEINLRDRDVANMGFAEKADIPVILIADIDRGGVFAHLVGTLALLSPSEQARVKGFVINRFRGDSALLQPGLDWLEEYTGKPVLGVLPYLHGLYLDAEDGLSTNGWQKSTDITKRIRVVAPVFPRIINHTDLDALRLHPHVDFSWVGPGEQWPQADLIVLPGSANIEVDMQWLRAQGWEAPILRHLRYGGKLVGFGSGFYMLGKEIICAASGKPAAGLGVLDMRIRQKETHQIAPSMVKGELSLDIAHSTYTPVTGYQLSFAHITDSGGNQPIIRLNNGQTEGLLSPDGQIVGTQIHGLFDTAEALSVLLEWVTGKGCELFDLAAQRERGLERLADTIEAHLDMPAIISAMKGSAAQM